MNKKEKYYYNCGKNIKKLIDITEKYNQFLLFLFYERDIKSLKIKIGTFKYEGDIYNFYAVLETINESPDIFFLEKKDNSVLKGNKYYRLTDLSFGWGFDEAEINFNEKIINDFVKILSKEDIYTFDSIYDEVHCHFW